MKQFLSIFSLILLFSGLSGQDKKLSGGPSFSFFIKDGHVPIINRDTFYLYPEKYFWFEVDNNSCSNCNGQWLKDGLILPMYSVANRGMATPVLVSGKYSFDAYCTDFGLLQWWGFTVKDRFTVTNQTTSKNLLLNEEVDLNICETDSIQLQLDFDTIIGLCNTFQWKRNGIDIPNSTTRNLIIKETGLYSVSSTCTDCGNLTFGKFNVTCYKAPEIRFVADFSVYPNPASEKLFIEVKEYENSILTIFNVSGVTILAKKLESAFSEIDISGLNNGMYFVALDSNSKRTSRKILKNSK